MLGLTSRTPTSWVAIACDGLDGLLVDHAHCELKAASNALGLVARSARWPGLATALCDVAEEELAHFRTVCGVLERRGLALGTPAVCDYADRLRKSVRRTGKPSPDEVLVDRLLVAALIEARSCERFKLLSEGLAARGEPLAELFASLLASEARHYRAFVDLAVTVAGDEAAVRTRLAEAAAAEGAIADTLGRRPTLHG
jgi:tRNA-(ms[2]io[6]A)-hydroxylase